MFANSGIPLLEKLANYYSKAREEFVSTAQVRTMITNKEVSFQDVRSVLWDMTNAGGEFYQMQEVMAESLAAKYRNLGNAFNLMLADMAESDFGSFLKRIAEGLTAITESWSNLARVIGMTSLSVGIMRGLSALTAVGKASLTAGLTESAAKEAIKNAGRLGTAIEGVKQTAIKAGNSIKNFFAANWITMAIATITAAATYLYSKWKSYNEELDKTNEAFKKMAAEGLKNIYGTIENNINTFDVKTASKKQIKEQIKVLKEEVKKYDPIWEDTFSRIFEINENTGKSVNDVTKQYEELVTRVLQLKDAYQQADASKPEVKNLVSQTGNWLFDKNFTENSKDLAEQFQKVREGIVADLSNMTFEEASSNLENIMNSLQRHLTQKGQSEVFDNLNKQVKEFGNNLNGAYELLAKFFLNYEVDPKMSLFGSTDSSFGMAIKSMRRSLATTMEDGTKIAELISNIYKNSGLISDNLAFGTEEMKKAFDALDEKTKDGIHLLIKGMIDPSTPSDVAKRLENGIWDQLFTLRIRGEFEDKSVEELSEYQQNIINAIPSVASEKIRKTLEDIVSKGDDVKGITDAIVKAVRDAKSEVDKAKDEIELNEYSSEEVKANAKKQYNEYRSYYENLLSSLKVIAPYAGVDLDSILNKKSKNGRGNKTDEDLKKEKERWKQYQYIWDGYKRLAETMSDSDAWNKVQEDAPWKHLFGDNWKSQDKFLEEVDTFIKNYKKTLVDGLSSTNENYEGRQTFLAQLFKSSYTMGGDIAKPFIEKFIAQTKDEIDKATESFNIYEQVFAKTGNADLASSIAQSTTEKNVTDLVSELVSMIRANLKAEHQGIDLSELVKLDEKSIKGYLKDSRMASSVVEMLKSFDKAVKDKAKQSRDIYLNAISSIMTAEDKFYAKDAQRIKEINDAIAQGLDIAPIEEKWKREMGEAAMEWMSSVESPIRDVMNSASMMLSGRLLSSMKKVREIINYLKNGGNKPSGVTDKQLEALKGNLGSILDLYQGLNDSSDKFWDTFSSAGGSLGTFIGGLGKGISKLTMFKGAIEKVTKAKKDDDRKEAQEQLDALTNSTWQSFGEGLASGFGILSDMCGKMKELAEISGDVKLAKDMESAAAALSVAASTAQGAATGGWIGAAVGFTTSTLSELVNNIFEAAKYNAQFEQSMRNYQRAIVELKLQTKEDDWKNIFGTKEISYAVDAWQKAGKTLETIKSTYMTLPNINLDDISTTDLIVKGNESLKYLKTYADAVGESYKDAYNSLKTYWVKVQDGGFFGTTEYDFLGNIAPEMFDEEGFINVDEAKKFLETNQQITDELRSQIEHAIQLQEIYEEDIKIVDELLSSWYGDWASTLTDAIFDGIINGTDAWSEFEKAGAEAVLAIGKTMLNSTVFNAFFSKFQKQLEGAFGADDPISKILEISGQMYNELPDAFNAANAMAESYIQAAKDYGFNFDSLKESGTGLSTTIKGVTEETADILAAYVNGIRADVSVQREVIQSIGVNVECLPQLSVIAESQLTQLNMIAENTRLGAEYAAICADRADEMMTLWSDVTTGVKKVSIN